MNISNEAMSKWRKALFDQLVKRGLEMPWEEFKRHFARTMVAERVTVLPDETENSANERR